MPAVSEPSPITAMVRLSSCFRNFAQAIPNPAEMDVLLWPVEKLSYGLSLRRVKPESPPCCRRLENASRRPVRSLCA